MTPQCFRSFSAALLASAAFVTVPAFAQTAASPDKTQEKKQDTSPADPKAIDQADDKAAQSLDQGPDPTETPVVPSGRTETVEGPNGENIVVEATKIKGSLETDVPPTLTLSDKDIAAYGASSITELLGAIPQTRSGNSRGGGGGMNFSQMPILLVNGRRISNFGEVFSLPPEAIRRVEVYPEEVALKLGYSPDQRVVNMILKPGFASTAVEFTFGGPTSGGRKTYEGNINRFQATKNGRNNFSAKYDRGDAITESERDIVQPIIGDQAFRTLVPKSQSLQVNGLMSRTLKSSEGVTANLQYNRSNSDGLNGLPRNGLLDPLQRDTKSDSITGGLTLDGAVRRWQWSLTLNGTYSATDSESDRPVLAAITKDSAAFRTNTINSTYTISGSPVRMPAGPATLNIRLGADRIRVKSRSLSAAGAQRGSVGRNAASGRANIDVPITSKRFGVLGAIGDISVNGNFGYRDVSDFGGLYNYGYGLSWKPFEKLSTTMSFTAEDSAPTTSQLGNAILTTQNVPYFDFVRGQSVLVAVTSGGNRQLREDKKRDFKLGANFTIVKDALTLDTNYFRNKSTNPISDFPAAVPLVEAAFPTRFQRNAAGQLIAVDQSAVNFAEAKTESIRWGLSFFKQFKAPQQGFGGFGAPARPAGGRPQGGSGGGPRGGGGRGGGGGGGGMMGGPPGGGMFVSLYHNYRIADEVRIAANQPFIDLLNGGTINLSGGNPQHSIELESGYFRNGIGVRASANWRESTTVSSGATSDLRFGSLATFSIRGFINFDQRKPLIKKYPFLKGARAYVRLLNITNAVQKVEDATGVVPFRYQRGFIDPIGRVIEVGFRKLF